MTHVPAPSEHAPRKQALIQGKHLFVEEVEKSESAWISCDIEDTIDVRQ